ncbi:hypothetical protein AKJ51_03975 [candidate division MSBL1 archaeon SCGC-AAA382A20]|uniref:Phosphoglycerate kinase n=1 Tax=candidate division MSBL1 archaeon SCGC-AAA382A20 TaxID=1698280 RepID=A0A133VIJ4_9EURY|nr:hypothetical protein AKJ51_03975 [candidate division MSBL1 archaeon SCGC-AAA382A20]
MKGISKVDVTGKRILVRVDLNSTVIDEEVQMTPKIKEHSKTLDELADRGAEVVAISHQGRPGGKDFLHLKQHAQLMEDFLNRNINFVKSVCDKKAIEEINNLNRGEILLLDNVRMHEDELKDVSPAEHGNSELVKKLSEVCDIYANDAFSVCHRNQASITGFPQVVDSYVGPLLEEELEALERLDHPREPVHFVLGGNKPEDAVNVIYKMLEKNEMDLALLGGAVGEVFLQVSGLNLGSKGYDLGGLKQRIQYLIENYRDNLVLPKDVAYEEDSERKEIPVEKLPASRKIYDIGMETVEDFKERLGEAETVVMNGPLGNIEYEVFRKPTEEILKAISDMDKFTLVGGGDTSKFIDDIGFDLEKDFSHVSLAGGAFISYLSGEKLPGIEALK